MRAARIDANHRAIVRALRDVGCYVEPRLARIGGGCPDLLVCRQGVWRVAELKDGSKPPSEQQLTPAEQVWHAEALMIGGGKVEIWRSADEALAGVMQHD